MRAINIIFRRELATYLRSPMGYVVCALLLFVDGILFQTYALGAKKALSADVLRVFFMYTGVVTQIAGLALSVRLIAEERQQHTIVLLNTSPVRDVEIVAGKFLAAFVFLAGMLIASLYMPLLIYVNGKITVSQLVVGYLGLLLLGGSSLAIGLFASSLTRIQLVALAVGVGLNAILAVLYPLASVLEAPFSTVFQNVDLWWIHFQKGFMVGIWNLSDTVFYLSVIYFFLLLATKTTEAKRWR